jgi:hypothetical protein
VPVDDLPHLSRWIAQLDARPGCAAGLQKPPKTITAAELVQSAQTIVVR